MKRLILHKLKFNNSLCILFIGLALVIFLQGCYKVSHNGDLDGMWRIITIENAEGEELPVEGQRFYCFYMNTVNLTIGPILYTANMQYDYPDIYLEFPYASPGQLIAWGIYSDKVKFQIMKIDRSNLILKSDDVLITLKKF